MATGLLSASAMDIFTPIPSPSSVFSGKTETDRVSSVSVNRSGRDVEAAYGNRTIAKVPDVHELSAPGAHELAGVRLASPCMEAWGPSPDASSWRQMLAPRPSRRRLGWPCQVKRHSHKGQLNAQHDGVCGLRLAPWPWRMYEAGGTRRAGGEGWPHRPHRAYGWPPPSIGGGGRPTARYMYPRGG